MESMSLAEAVLHGIAEESGVVPEGGLLERLEKAPPGARRRLARLDADVLALCGLAPLELAGILTGLMDTAGDDLRIDPERAWDAVVGARGGTEPAHPDATADGLLALAHAALGLPSPCPACSEWEPPEDDEADDGPDAEGVEAEQDDPHSHEGPLSLLDRVYTVHADVLDTWEAQVALRIAMDAGENLAEIAGFEVLHDVVGHARDVPGIDRERRGEIHTVQHVGMSLCIDAAQVQGLRVAHRALAGEGGVADRIQEAERAAAEESGVLAAVAASVVVDRIAPAVTDLLEQSPPSAPPTGRARPRRRR